MSNGGHVRVYESSAASGPHVWLTATVPSDLNDPDSNVVEAPVHLTLENAALLRDQLTQLIGHHYQLDVSTTERATCAAGMDGECYVVDCVQARDGEPDRTGRFCPLPIGDPLQALREGCVDA